MWKRKYARNIQATDTVYLWENIPLEVKKVTKKRDGTITLTFKRPEWWRDAGWRATDFVANFKGNQRPLVWKDGRKK